METQNIKKTSCPDIDKIKETARGLEQVFLYKCFEQCISDMSNNSIIGGGHGESIYNSMLIMEFSMKFAQQEPIGIKDYLIKHYVSDDSDKT